MACSQIDRDVGGPSVALALAVPTGMGISGDLPVIFDRDEVRVAGVDLANARREGLGSWRDLLGLMTESVT